MNDRGLREPILRHAAEGKPLLGICLGMQLLFEGSDESPGARGLGLLEGTVRRFTGVRVPHIGWNDVRWRNGERTSCYFVHSFFVHTSPAAAGWTVHGTEFVSAVYAGSVAGFQFHPEKSHDAGLRVLDRTIRRLCGAPREGV
jgi:imidazole glycerol phosphate synthase glutamine amidotransferase subunit